MDPMNARLKRDTAMNRVALLAALVTLCLGSACAPSAYEMDKRQSDAQALRGLGEAYLNQGNLTEALRAFLEADEKFPGDPILQTYIGIAYMKKKNNARAIEHFQQAVALKPDYAVARNYLGTVYLLDNQVDKAIEVLTALVKDSAYELYATPHYPKNTLGWAYYRKEMYAEAEKQFLAALAYYDIGIPKDVTYVEIQRGLGLTYGAQGATEKAIRHLEKAVEAYPNVPEIYLDLARLYRRAGRLDQSLKAYEKVGELAPESDLAAEARQEATALR
jgi:tetratricopeptide (TPR) repeat protein